MAPTLRNGSVWRSVDWRTRSVTAKHHVPLKLAWPTCSVSQLPNEGSPQLLGHDLDHRAGAAVLSGPATLLEPAHD